MSDTVTIHNGHCSYHGPADKAPAWARGQIPAPTTSFEDTTHAWEEGYRAGLTKGRNEMRQSRVGFDDFCGGLCPHCGEFRGHGHDDLCNARAIEGV